MKNKKWSILGNINSINKDSRKEEIVSVLLKNRGLNKKREIEEFFNPREPSELTLSELDISQIQVNKAIKRIKKAIKDKEKIVVYSDYDADGICGAAILWETLHNIGADVLPYVPHREKEGYGLSETGIKNILSDEFYTKGDKPSLIITVDHGIVANKEVEFAKKMNLEVIIVDHHEKGENLPEAIANVHTTKLCGAGVAYIFTRQLLKLLARAGKFQGGGLLELAGIATIADLVPLTGANRSFVKYGLHELNRTKRPGLLAIFEEAGIQKGNIGTYEVGFIIGPRLNAMGRMVHALDTLRLLCTNDMNKARSLAHILGLTNKERQQLTFETTLHAKTLLNQQTAATQKSKKIIFLYHESYNQGVIGLVAGRLMEEFYLPAIVISKGEEFSKASARSISGFNIIEAIRETSDLLVNCGGHPMAAGFTVETVKLEILQKRIEDLAEKKIPDEKLERTLKIDLEVELSDINWGGFGKVSEFAPFGMGNPEPVFCLKDIVVQNFQTMGIDGKHLKLFISNKDGHLIEALGFGMGNLASELIKQQEKGKTIDLAFIISSNIWNGNKKLQLKIKDVK